MQAKQVAYVFRPLVKLPELVGDPDFCLAL